MNLDDVLHDFQRDLLPKSLLPFRPSPQEQRDKLYHYTNAEGLKGILTTGEIWATHAFYLNDPREVSYGHGILKGAIATFGRLISTPKHYTFLRKCFESFEKQMSQEGDLPAAYFASFSTEADDLSQYRAYSDGGAGYCLGFATAELVENAGQPTHGAGSLFTLEVMDYSEPRQETAMEGIFIEGWNRASEIVDQLDGPDPEEIYRRIAEICVYVAFRLCIYFKQPGFQSEGEQRIVPTPFGPPGALPLNPFMDSRICDGLFVPYLKIPIADKNGKTSLKEIYIGPKLPFERAHSALLKLDVFQQVEKGGSVEIKRSATFLQ